MVQTQKRSRTHDETRGYTMLALRIIQQAQEDAQSFDKRQQETAKVFFRSAWYHALLDFVSVQVDDFEPDHDMLPVGVFR